MIGQLEKAYKCKQKYMYCDIKNRYRKAEYQHSRLNNILYSAVELLERTYATVDSKYSRKSRCYGYLLIIFK